MDLQSFKESVTEAIPPNNLQPLLLALWHDAKGDWNTAHDIADGPPGKEAAWVHAYLHRKEGDDWNANYWYRRAGRKMPACSLEEEWEMLVNHFVKK